MKILWVPVLIVLISTCFGCTSQTIDDAAITLKVKEGLVADKNTSALKISVETHDGIVTLTGVVPTGTEKATAGRVAANTEKVKRVVNNITVDPKSIGATNFKEKVGEATERTKENITKATESAGETISDAAILAKIKSQFIARGITGTSVDVKNGDVTIKGEVENAQEKVKAEEVAKEIYGVKNVENRLTVKK